MSECECPENWIGDHECDTMCNNKACHYDGGDCSKFWIIFLVLPHSIFNSSFKIVFGSLFYAQLRNSISIFKHTISLM